MWLGATLNLPGQAAPSCRCPWREDKNPSFSVFDDGRRWKDHATGESGDAISFLANARGLSNTEAFNEFCWLAAKETPHTEKSVTLRPLTDKELGQLAESRDLSIEAVKLAQARRLLRFANLKDGKEYPPCWVVADSKGINMQARRLDRKPWQHIPGNPKAKTLKGSKASWPIGIIEAQDFEMIALVEGTPDLLSVFHHALKEGRENEVAPVCMLGLTVLSHCSESSS